MLLYAAGRARWPAGALPVRGQPAGQVGSKQCLRGRGLEGGELPHLSTDSGSCINLTVGIALGDPREEILEVLTRFRRRGNDDFPIHHREDYLSLITESGFDSKGLGIRTARLCPHRRIFVRIVRTFIPFPRRIYKKGTREVPPKSRFDCGALRHG